MKQRESISRSFFQNQHNDTETKKKGLKQFIQQLKRKWEKDKQSALLRETEK